MNTINDISYNTTRTTTRPSYYVWSDENGQDLWDTWGDRFGSFGACCACLSQVDKYLYRAGAKEGNPTFQELDKACRYYNKAVDYYYLMQDVNKVELSGHMVSMSAELIKRITEEIGGWYH